MKTAMQEIIEAWYSPDKIDNFDAWLGNNETRLLEKERNQIEGAYNSAKNYPDLNCDGKKYYFMNYVSND
jgi:hypothetical protein